MTTATDTIKRTRAPWGSQIKQRWVRIDGWRGYYETYAPEGSRYAKVHDDVILSMSEDEARLKEFDTEMRRAFRREGISVVRKFPRTSNVFAVGYDLFVEKEKQAKAEKILKGLKEKYR